MPHRRSRKSSAVFLCWVMTLFFTQASIYPVQGHESAVAGYFSPPAQVMQIAASSPAGTEVVADPSGVSEIVEKVLVRKGETLWNLAQEYGTTVEEMGSLNGLREPSLIQVGQGLWVPISPAGKDSSAGKIQIVNVWMTEPSAGSVSLATTAPVSGRSTSEARTAVAKLPTMASETASRGEQAISFSQSDVDLLARVIYAEARGEDFEGQVAVGAVVLNRVKDRNFPKTIRDVIYQPGAFTSVTDHQILLKPDESAYKAARAALSGADPTGGAVYYYNPRLTTDHWIKSRPVIKQIGNHIFSI